MKYTVNEQDLSYDASGDRTHGDRVVLLEHAVDLTAGTSWAKEGFTVEPLFTPELYHEFTSKTHVLLTRCWRQAGLDIPEHFALDQYHLFAADNLKHLAAVEQTKIVSIRLFPVDITLLEERISRICQLPLRVRNPFDSQSIFHFRVIRPGKQDYNPLHRDVWLEDYKDCINLYIPIAGSNENSSLVIIPGSHYWPESFIERTITGAVMNGTKFNVPAVTNIEHEVTYVRPNPSGNEVLVFSPYLLHGGSSNLNPSSTRISIEIRLWKK